MTVVALSAENLLPQFDLGWVDVTHLPTTRSYVGLSRRGLHGQVTKSLLNQYGYSGSGLRFGLLSERFCLFEGDPTEEVGSTDEREGFTTCIERVDEGEDYLRE